MDHEDIQSPDLELCQCESFGCGSVPLEGSHGRYGRYLTRHHQRAHRVRDRLRDIAQGATIAATSGENTSTPPPTKSSPMLVDEALIDEELDLVLPQPVRTGRHDTEMLPPDPGPIEDGQQQSILKSLDNILKSLEQSGDAIPSNPSFIFTTPPYQAPPITQIDPTPEQIGQFCRLDPTAPSNLPMFHHLEHISEALRLSTIYARPECSIAVRIRGGVVAERAKGCHWKVSQAIWNDWSQQHGIKTEVNVVDTSHYYRSNTQFMDVGVLSVYIMVATLYLLSNTSQDDCSWILNCMALELGLRATQKQKLRPDHSLKSIHRTVDPIIDTLNLRPRFTSFICCKECYSIYWFDPDNPTADLPQRCTNRAKGSQCNAHLLRIVPDSDRHRPARTYLYQSPQEFLIALFSRSDLQPYLYDDPCLRGRTSAEDSDVCDMWDAEGLRNFTFTDGKRFTSSATESRLIFSLNMDGLNPYGNKQSGKKVSVGAVYMVCMNLPPELRYRIENVYLVGVIPGPGQPSLEELNSLLKPLIDDFLILWETGMYLSRTARHPHGIRVRGAIVPLVCDLPAARQMSGFATHSHTVFCSECKLRRQDIANIDKDTWEMRTWEEHIELAESWRAATTEAARAQVYTTHGVRWTELLRLPYWDPTKYTLIDSMHAFYLRLFQHHIRTIWGMDVKIADEEGPKDPSHVPPTEIDMKHASFVLRHGSDTRLGTLRKDQLTELCREATTLSADGTRRDLVKRLRAYRVGQEWWTESGMHIVPGGDHVTPYERLSDGTTTDDFFWHASKTMVRKASKPDLLKVFRRHVLPSLPGGLSERAVQQLLKEDLVVHLQNERRRLHITDTNDCHTTQQAKQARNQCANILGKNALKEIRHDMSTINRPSWQPNGPRNPGEAKFGKFSAAQWRTFCTINLPTTLVRIWGRKPPDSFLHRCLDNFMHLVTAVKLACMGRMNEERINKYEESMELYLSTLLELFPKTDITPYQHLALHFPRHLRMFGPVHAWRCFAFERYNFVIQSFPTNHKFGQLEKTMFIKFCSAQRVRAIFSQHDGLPDDLRPMAAYFDENYGKKFQMSMSEVMLARHHQSETETRSWGDDELTPISGSTWKAVQAWILATDVVGPGQVLSDMAYFRSSISRYSQVFSTMHQHQSNSHVIYHPDTRDLSTWVAGTIQNLFTHTRMRGGVEYHQTFATIAVYEELSRTDSKQDLYRQYPDVSGRLVYNRLKSRRVLVPFGNVACHFVSQVQAVPHVDRECLLVLPLDRD